MNFIYCFYLDPLFIAIYYNKLEIVKLLIEQVDLSFKKRYNNQSPLAFADKNGNNDIFAYLIKKDDFNSDQRIDGLTFFEDAFLNDEMKYQMKYIMKMPELKIIGKFTMNHFSIITNRILELINNNSFSRYINDLPFYYNTGNRYIKTNYFFDLIKFCLEDTGDETIENNKRKEVNKKNAFYACLAAGILNEEEFSFFLDRFDIDINGQINEITPLFCSIKNKEDTLKIILEKFNDEIDINYCTPTQNISAFHILCGMPIIYNKQGCKLFLQMKERIYILLYELLLFQTTIKWLLF